MNRDPPSPSDDLVASPAGRRIVGLAREATGVNFDLYRTAPLARTIEHRMRATGATSVEAYAAMALDPTELRALSDALLIRTTEMFREAPTFALLREQALPKLLAERALEQREIVLAWVAACSTGEEAWSMAMCLADACREQKAGIESHVIASDVHAGAIEIAKRALLSAAAAAAVPAALAARWLFPEGAGFRPVAALAGAVTFAVHDLLSPAKPIPREAVFPNFDLIACRNVLIYLRPEVQAQVIARLAAALVPGGLLVLGEAEALPPAFDHALERIDPHLPVWRRG